MGGFGNARRGKRKLESLEPVTQNTQSNTPERDHAAQRKMIAHHLGVLKAATPDLQGNKASVQQSLSALAEVAKAEDRVDDIIALGGIEVVVPLLSACAVQLDAAQRQDLERDGCLILSLSATKNEYQRYIAQQRALPEIVSLLRRYAPVTGQRQVNGYATRRAADVITNLAHENVEIKEEVREEGGIPPLVALLSSDDVKVQRAAAGALRTLAFKCEANKNQIVNCNALPVLIHMLRSEDTAIHYEAVGVIGNLVHSSQPIKRAVLEEGALQPVIALLSSPCIESQREAALLLGQFATTEPDYKAKIVQRGAVPPLVTMLHSSELQLKEMAAFALGRLAQNPDNQAGIVQSGGLQPLLALLNSDSGNLQHNAAFALYGLVDNEDNIADFIKEDGVHRLLECNTIVQQSKDCVQKTLKRLEDKLKNRDPPARWPIGRLVYSMQNSASREVRQRFATALAYLVTESDLKLVFVERGGLDVLLEMLRDKNKDTSRHAAGALCELCQKAVGDTTQDPASAGSQLTDVYLGQQYVNSKTMSDVTFLVEGQPFYAHRIALVAVSDTFRAMFEGNYKEREADHIPIPNIRFEVFSAMMQCIYTGKTEVTTDNAQELLAAADQYMLEKLKVLAQHNIAQELSSENVADVYEMAVDYHALELTRKCMQFVLRHYDECLVAVRPKEFNKFVDKMVPDLKNWLETELEQCSEGGQDGAAVPPPAQPNQQHAL